MIVRAKVVVTMDGPPIENGAVQITGNRIGEVGKFADLTSRHSEPVVDIGEQALLPGLINAHCHLDYTALRGKIPPQKSFTDWIGRINIAKSALTADDYIQSINAGFAEAKSFGTTSIADLTAVPELISRTNPSIRTSWFAELIDVRDQSRPKKLVFDAVDCLRSAECWGLAPHAPFTASADLYRECERAAGPEDALLTTHLAESRDEMAMFSEGRGALYEFLKSIGRDMSDCGGKTPIARFFEVIGRDGSINQRYLLVHLNEITAADVELLAKYRMDVVHCARSHEYFGHSPFQFDLLLKSGFTICLGTDSLASNEDLSLFAEMRQFRKKFPNVAAAEVLSMVTVNAAHALRRGNELGKITPGFLADLIAVPCSGSEEPFDEIIDFESAVEWSMIDGVAKNAA